MSSAMVGAIATVVAAVIGAVATFIAAHSGEARSDDHAQGVASSPATPAVSPSPGVSVKPDKTDNCVSGIWQGAKSHYDFDIKDYGQISLDLDSLRLRFTSSGTGYKIYDDSADIVKVVNGHTVRFHFSGMSKFHWETNSTGTLFVDRDSSTNGKVQMTDGGEVVWSTNVYLNTGTYKYTCVGDDMTFGESQQLRRM